MSNTSIRVVKKSVIMLFSFALIASILTMVNMEVSRSGGSNSLSNTSTAHAEEIDYTNSHGTSTPVPSGKGCQLECGPTQQTGVKSGQVTDPNLKSVFYACSNVTSSGVCNVNSTSGRTALIITPYCEWALKADGNVVARSGSAAVTYIKANYLGEIWNPIGPAERMFNHLTGSGLWFKSPFTNDAGIWGFGYNGTTVSRSEGNLWFGCNERFEEDIVVTPGKKHTCAPVNDGRPFPYAVGYVITYRNWNPNHGGYDWQVFASGCVYVSKNTPPPKVEWNSQNARCYYGIQHSGFFSTNRAAINNGGTPTTIQPTSPPQNAIKPHVSQGGTSASRLVNCTTMIRMDASLSLEDGYAYYRLQGFANWQEYRFYAWDPSYTGGVYQIADIRPGKSGVVTERVYGTHSCTTNPAYQKYPSHASLPTISFKYSDCKRNIEWACKIPNPPLINGVYNNVQLMRDGNHIPTNLGGVNVSGAGVRDINSKAVGTVSDNNMSYKVGVVGGSSPFAGTNPNASKQYFELWKGDKKTETQWNSWVKQPNANKNSFLTYYWSSDNGEKWQMNYQAKLDIAEFGVPFQSSTTSGQGTRWKTETNVDCDGVKTSNSATILRSVSSEK